MEELRKIIREELAKAIIQLNESPVFVQDDEKILHNFDAGRAFGINKLTRDIHGLEHYYMNSYFPNSEMKESWMFEIETNYGGSQIIEIIHQIGSNYESYWKINIGEVERGSSEPQIIATSGTVKDYNNFINKVNSTLEKTINPDLL